MIHFLRPCRQCFLLGGGERRPRGAEHPVRDRAAMIGNSGAAALNGGFCLISAPDWR